MHDNLRNNIKTKIDNFKSDLDDIFTKISSKSVINNNEPRNDNIFIKSFKKDPNKFNSKTWEWNDILVKSSFEDYNMRTIRIHDQILFLYENSTNANFYFFMPLYNINIDVYQNINSFKSDSFNYIKKVNLINPQEILNLYENYPNLILEEINSDFYFRLYHDFDTFEFIIKFNKYNLIAEMKTILQMILNNSYSGKSNSLYIKNINRTNLNILGSVYIEMLTFYAPFLERSIKFKINLDPYKIYTKTITSTQKFSINQRFKIPLHNRFNIFKISLFKVEEKSLYVKNEEKQKLSEYSICLPESISNLAILIKARQAQVIDFCGYVYRRKTESNPQNVLKDTMKNLPELIENMEKLLQNLSLENRMMIESQVIIDFLISRLMHFNLTPEKKDAILKEFFNLQNEMNPEIFRTIFESFMLFAMQCSNPSPNRKSIFQLNQDSN